MNNFIGWTVENWQTVSLTLLSVWRVVDLVAKLTPTNTDNEFVDTVNRLFLKKG